MILIFIFILLFEWMFGKHLNLHRSVITVISRTVSLWSTKITMAPSFANNGGYGGGDRVAPPSVTGRFASVYSEVQNSRIGHTLPLPSVLKSPFKIVDGAQSSAAGNPGLSPSLSPSKKTTHASASSLDFQFLVIFLILSFLQMRSRSCFRTCSGNRRRCWCRVIPTRCSPVTSWRSVWFCPVVRLLEVTMSFLEFSVKISFQFNSIIVCCNFQLYCLNLCVSFQFVHSIFGFRLPTRPSKWKHIVWFQGWSCGHHEVQIRWAHLRLYLSL